MTTPYHVPVLADEALRLLAPRPDGTYVDGTLGGGGHARRIAQELGPAGRLLAIDRDRDALAAAARAGFTGQGRVELTQGNFARTGELLAALGWGRADGILLDLGVSSHQLDAGEKGFSFLRDGPLDMRMDAGAGESAAELIARADERELQRIFREYGEEPRARRVARAVVAAREREPLRSTAQLAAVVERALGRRSHKHPGTRVFQALRIAVNEELSSLEQILARLPDLLEPGGRAVVITYHSLEDRRVKQAFREAEPHCRCDLRALRCTCGEPGVMRILTRKAVRPGPDEIAANPRARSAKLRAAERLEDTASRPDHGGAA